MATARGCIPNRPPRRIALPTAGRIAGVAVLALVAALIGWLAHSPGMKTMTRTVEQPPATIYQHTPGGAVAAVQTSLARIGSRPPIRPARGTTPGPGRINTTWNLLYRVLSYNPAQAVIQTWSFSLAVGYGDTAQDWSLNDTGVTWRAGRWIADRQPTGVAENVTPPAMDTTGARDHSFGTLLSGFRRFPGAP
jgi:hypothetical protein